MSLEALAYAQKHFDGMAYKKGGDGKDGIGPCHLIHEALTKTGVPVPFFGMEEWKAEKAMDYGFTKETAPKPGDIAVFGSCVAFYLSPASVYTSSVRGNGVHPVETCWFGSAYAYYRATD